MAQRVAGELYYDLDGQLAEIKRQLRQPNGYPYDPAELKLHLQAAIEGRFRNDEFSPRAANEFPSYVVDVNYDLKFEEMVDGDSITSTIASAMEKVRLVRSGRARVEVILVHFDRAISTGEVLRELDRLDLWPANFDILLALGAKHPEFQLGFAIAALGSVDGRNVPCLPQGGSWRRPTMYIDGGLWADGFRFAAFRKSV